MRFLRRGQHGDSWSRRTRAARPPVQYPGVLQAPGMPAPEPLPQRTPAPPWPSAGDTRPDRQRHAPARPPLPTVADLAEQVTQQVPVTRPRQAADAGERPLRPVGAPSSPPPPRPCSGVSSIWVDAIPYPDPAVAILDHRGYGAALRHVGAATGTVTGYETDAAWALAIDAGGPS